MPLSRLPTCLASAFRELAHWLDRRSAARLPLLLCGLLFAKGRRTVTSWFRAAGITDAYRPAYTTVRACGREASHLALSILHAVRPLLGGERLTVALDDTPTPRYGRHVEGCGRHHNPSPGPAGSKYVYGHVWVTLAALAKHPAWGAHALPLQARLYVRQADREHLPSGRRPPFQTKLQLAAQQLHWLKPWVEGSFPERWAVVDGGYAKKPFLRPAQQDGFVVVSRLRKDAHLCDLPPSQRRPGQRGRCPRTAKSASPWPSGPGTREAGSRSRVCRTASP